MRGRRRRFARAALDEHREVGGRRVRDQRRQLLLAGKPHRVQLHAKRRFDRIVPARLDVDRLPQALCAVEPVLRDPAAQLGVGLELFLLALQCLQRRFQPGQFARPVLQLREHRLAFCVQRGQLRFRRGQRRLERLQLRGERLARAGEAFEHLRLGNHQRHVLLLEAILARLELPEDLQRVRLARLLDALFLFGGGQFRFGGAHRGRGLLRCSLGFGHPRPHRLEFAFARGYRRARAGDLGLPAVAVAVRGGDARLDLHGLARYAFELRAHAAAVLAEILQFLLELRDLGIGGVKGALQAVQQVGLLEMAVAHLFLPALGLAQFRRLRLQQHLRLAHFVGGAVLRGLRLAQPREGEQVVREREIGLQVVVARRDLGLLAEALELAGEFAGDVAHAGEVVARVLEAQLGFAAALAVLRHARGLLEEHAQLLGARRDDARDHPLLDDGVGARARARCRGRCRSRRGGGRAGCSGNSWSRRRGRARASR